MSLQPAQRETNTTRQAKLKVTTVITRQYYVEYHGGGIYGGPFDSKADAETCLEVAKQLEATNLSR